MTYTTPTARERLLTTPDTAPPAARLRHVAEILATLIQELEIRFLDNIPEALLGIAAEIEAPRQRGALTVCAELILAMQRAGTEAELNDVLLQSRVHLSGMSADERSRCATEYLMRCAVLGRDGK